MPQAAAAAVCLWQSGGFVQMLLPMEILRLLERPWHTPAQMQLCLNGCGRGFLSLQVFVKGVKAGLILPFLPGALRP